MNKCCLFRLLIRETQGIMSDQHQRAFSTRHVKRCAASTPFKPPIFDIEHLFMTIDPSGGGASHFAICTMLYHKGLAVVCGIESVCARTPDDYKEALLKHTELLQKTYPRALLVVCPEANLGFESSHISRFMEQVKNMVMMYETASGVPGMLTSHDSKEVMWSLTREKLREHAILFTPNIISTGDGKMLKNNLCTQFQNYSVIFDRPDALTQHFRETKRTYSGKMYGNDDLIVMLQFNILAYKRFYANPKYRQWW